MIDQKQIRWQSYAMDFRHGKTQIGPAMTRIYSRDTKARLALNKTRIPRLREAEMSDYTLVSSLSIVVVVVPGEERYHVAS